jgi:hypothetical protein
MFKRIPTGWLMNLKDIRMHLGSENEDDRVHKDLRDIHELKLVFGMKQPYPSAEVFIATAKVMCKPFRKILELAMSRFKDVEEVDGELDYRFPTQRCAATFDVPDIMGFLKHLNAVYECHLNNASNQNCGYSYSSADGLTSRHQAMVRQLFENEHRSGEEAEFLQFDFFCDFYSDQWNEDCIENDADLDRYLDTDLDNSKDGDESDEENSESGYEGGDGESDEDDFDDEEPVDDSDDEYFE